MPREQSQPSVYDQVVKITHIYLGPAADRFIARQVENHLHKSPNDLSQADLAELIDWIRAVVALLTDDEEIVSDYITELQQLASRIAKSNEPN